MSAEASCNGVSLAQQWLDLHMCIRGVHTCVDCIRAFTPPLHRFRPPLPERSRWWRLKHTPTVYCGRVDVHLCTHPGMQSSLFCRELSCLSPGIGHEHHSCVSHTHEYAHVHCIAPPWLYCATYKQAVREGKNGAFVFKATHTARHTFSWINLQNVFNFVLFFLMSRF